ncbi:hypothetical protein [Streptomyces synnematoformans]|uniref:hypothetical protein n=1 Tax=Streptomyces synnematoformans TaxID=415721 RepID=UPI0031D743BE
MQSDMLTGVLIGVTTATAITSTVLIARFLLRMHRDVRTLRVQTSALRLEMLMMNKEQPQQPRAVPEAQEQDENPPGPPPGARSKGGLWLVPAAILTLLGGLWRLIRSHPKESVVAAALVTTAAVALTVAPCADTGPPGDQRAAVPPAPTTPPSGAPPGSGASGGGPAGPGSASPSRPHPSTNGGAYHPAPSASAPGPQALDGASPTGSPATGAGNEGPPPTASENPPDGSSLPPTGTGPPDVADPTDPPGSEPPPGADPPVSTGPSSGPCLKLALLGLLDVSLCLPGTT